MIKIIFSFIYAPKFREVQIYSFIMKRTYVPFLLRSEEFYVAFESFISSS